MVRVLKFREFDYNRFPYFYLTPEYNYALTCYANKKHGVESVLTFKIDTNNFIDFTQFEKQYSYYLELTKLLYQKIGFGLPPELRQHFPCYFWEMIRRDTKGYFKKRLLSKGINGFKMIETWYSNDDDSDHVVYCLLNNDSIVREIKEDINLKFRETT